MNISDAPSQCQRHKQAYNICQTKTKYLKYGKQKYSEQDTKYANHNTKYPKQKPSTPNREYKNVNLYSKILIYDVLSQGNFCREFTHFLAHFLQA